MFAAAIFVACLSAAPAIAADAIGQIKTVSGAVAIERADDTTQAVIGDSVYQQDVIRTGPDGKVGITFVDLSMFSAGPGTELKLERFRFNRTTHDGVFESRIRRGSLSGVSGRIAANNPDAMKIRTYSAILGVRGTKFVIEVEGH
ncbi:FecR family protein [Rhodospira trueperi]|uniref:FecR family protein n=1 Tax=Rhodospira trueperi TaxID=69960 RepID=UPI001C408E59|nr:FecR domain-containing protein [Rhodospira trueperi]